jgi:hypothetical protein
VNFAPFTRLAAIDLERVAQRVFTLSNQERVQRCLPAVQRHAGLDCVAAYHSEDMARRNFFDHINPDGMAPQDRLRLIRPQLLGCTSENLAWISLRNEEVIPSDVVNGWMLSRGHRENLLQPTHTHMGISVVQSGDRVYSTQLLAGLYLEALEYPIPIFVKANECHRIRFRFQGGFPSADLSMMLELPNKGKWVPIGNFRFAKGAVSLTPRWSSILDCHVDFAAMDGRGKYELFAGQVSTGQYCPTPLQINAS